MINGKVCACGKNTPYTDWTICEDCHKAEHEKLMENIREGRPVSLTLFSDSTYEASVVGGDDD